MKLLIAGTRTRFLRYLLVPKRKRRGCAAEIASGIRRSIQRLAVFILRQVKSRCHLPTIAPSATGDKMFNRNATFIAAAVAATFATTAARANTITLDPAYWSLSTYADAISNNNVSVPAGAQVENIASPSPYTAAGSVDGVAGGFAKATIAISTAPAGLEGQATATAYNIQTYYPYYDGISAAADFYGSLRLNFMVAGPPLPNVGGTVPVDIEGAEFVKTGASPNHHGSSQANASINVLSTTLTVSSSNGSTKNSALSFNVKEQLSPDSKNSIYMNVSGSAGSWASNGKAGGTVSASAGIDPFIYIDSSFAGLYPGIDPNLYSIVVNSEFLNIPPATSQVPLPATLPLFATGLGALGLLGWRRKRKLQAVAA